jgi:hypothetical protein
VALVLTLLLTPVAYSIVEDISEIRLCAWHSGATKSL